MEEGNVENSLWLGHKDLAIGGNLNESDFLNFEVRNWTEFEGHFLLLIRDESAFCLAWFSL